MVYLPLPSVQAGNNPYDAYAAALSGVFDMTPAPGFEARLIVLWTLAAYGIVASVAYFAMVAADYRQRKKGLWLWRLVRRANGRYIVGNQHLLFALFSFIVCGVLLGYFINFHQVYLQKQEQQQAFFWRTMIFLCFGVHLWVASFANLQAGILASQSAARKYILSPVFLNTFYVGAFIVMLCSCLSLDIVCGVVWRQCWYTYEKLLTQIDTLSRTRPNDSPQEAMNAIGPLLDWTRNRLRLVIATLRAINALYAFGFSLIIAANLGGLALLFTLRRQIEFNMRRLSKDQSVGQPAASSGAPALTPPVTPPEENGSADEASHPFAFATRFNEKGSRAPARQVVFVRSVEQTFEGPGGPGGEPETRAQPANKNMSVGELKQAAATGSLSSAAQRQQAQQLLALKKVEWDVFILLAAIVLVALSCAGIGLWLAVSPTSVYDRWATTEVAYFLVPWMFLTGVDLALSLLLVNAIRYLIPHDSVFAKIFNVSAGKAPRRSSAAGLLSSSELDSYTIASSAGDVREPDEAGGRPS